MRTSTRNILSSALTAALLAGCGAAQTLAPTPSGASANPSASGGDLVYVTYAGWVSIYTYPGGKARSPLKGFHDTTALCSDASGDVWVVDVSAHHHTIVFEYPHGGSKPISRLSLKARGDACSVDPSSGNLAVGTVDSKVAIWTNAEGQPTLYSTHGFFKQVRTLAYDGSGNLYLRSYESHEPAAWLPKGGSSVVKSSIPEIGPYGWDGRHLVVARLQDSPASLTLYTLHEGNGKVAGHVVLDRCSEYYPNFSITGSKLAVSCGVAETASLDYFKYPAGGKPITYVSGPDGGVAISVATVP